MADKEMFQINVNWKLFKS